MESWDSCFTYPQKSYPFLSIAKERIPTELMIRKVIINKQLFIAVDGFKISASTTLQEIFKPICKKSNDFTAWTIWIPSKKNMGNTAWVGWVEISMIKSSEGWTRLKFIGQFSFWRWVFPKIGVYAPKMDGEHNGETPIFWGMIWGENPLCSETSRWTWPQIFNSQTYPNHFLKTTKLLNSMETRYQHFGIVGMLFQNDLILSGLEITLSCQTSSINSKFVFFTNFHSLQSNLLFLVLNHLHRSREQNGEV